jgi:hypothetical protein
MVALAVPAARAQQSMPFLGNGDYGPSEAGEAVEVYVSVFVDRMLNINDRAYEYEVRPQYYKIMSPVEPPRMLQRLRQRSRARSNRKLTAGCTLTLLIVPPMSLTRLSCGYI